MQGANLQSYIQAVYLSRGSRGKAVCQTAAESLISNLHLKGATRVKDYNALWSSPYNVHIINLPEPLNTGWEKMTEERTHSQADPCFPTCYQHLNIHTLSHIKKYKADKRLDVSSPETDFASGVNLVINLYWGGTQEHYKRSQQLCIKIQVRFLPAAPSTPTSSSVIHILTLTFMEPLDRGKAEYIEPEKRCRRGGEGADKAWWKKVEWSGWVGGWWNWRLPSIVLKERSIIRLHNYFLGHRVDIMDREWETILVLTPSSFCSQVLDDLTSYFLQQHLDIKVDNSSNDCVT